MIGLSINKDIKLEKGKEKRKTGSAVGLYKYLTRAAKALVVSETIVENSTRQYKTVCAVTGTNLSRTVSYYFLPLAGPLLAS